MSTESTGEADPELLCSAWLLHMEKAVNDHIVYDPLFCSAVQAPDPNPSTKAKKVQEALQLIVKGFRLGRSYGEPAWRQSQRAVALLNQLATLSGFTDEQLRILLKCQKERRISMG